MNTVNAAIDMLYIWLIMEIASMGQYLYVMVFAVFICLTSSLYLITINCMLRILAYSQFRSRDGGGCLYPVIQWKTAASVVQALKAAN